MVFQIENINSHCNHISIFIVADKKNVPLFAVESDGSLHKQEAQIKRDLIKDNLCKKFDFPLLRINTKYLNKDYRDYDLISWFIDVWFLHEAFYIQQENGNIPWDEPFDPMLLVRISSRKKIFPLFLSSEIRASIQDLFKKNRIQEPSPSIYVGTDNKEN